MPFRLLRCLARAVARHGVRFLCSLVPGGEALSDIAASAWEEYRQGEQEDALRAELEALARAPVSQVRQEVAAAVGDEAAALPPDVREKITTYLGQVPAMVRRSLRRPSDPSGTTVPASLRLDHAEDLVQFLPPNPPRLQIGDRPLPGVDRVLEEPLGVGGFGEVWKARRTHLHTKAPVALKFCLDPSAVRALRNEVGVLNHVMQLGHLAGVVPLLEAYLDADPPCLEYEYVEGGDLAGLIRELHDQRQMTPETANRLILQLAEVIASTHRASPPIVHEDLKPANILVRRATDGGYALFVTDFGIGGLAVAGAVRETRQPTRGRQQLLTEAVRGAYTPLYASPEQMNRRRGEPADPRDDIHALGVIWYQMLTGDLGMLSLPADWRDEVDERGLSAEVCGLLARCLAAKAAKRPADAVLLVRELRALIKADAPKRGASTSHEIKRNPKEGTSDDRQTLPNELRRKAEAGDAAAQFNIGCSYRDGRGVKQDYAEALRWYQKAADQGYAAAQCSIGVLYANGRGVKQDYAEALRWYQKAADQGDATAQSNIGWLYDHGRGVKQDYAEALRWYQKAADQGYAIAQYNMGCSYRDGQGVKQDYAEALRWYQKAAEQGDADAKQMIENLTRKRS
jgi:serine/threonine protein kinase